MIGDYIVDAFQSFFQSPSGWGIGLVIAFGAIWLAGYRPSLFAKPWLWAVLAGSAFVTLAAICFVQIPLQVWTGQALNHFWSGDVLTRWILLAAIPSMLLTGLVQEGAKLLPVVVYWRLNDKSLDPRLGLIVGAVAGAGFGIFEAQQVLNAQLATGMITWDVMKALGFMGLIYARFWHIFFIVAAQIAFSALAGYGLAKGWGWQFYLIASVLHGLLSHANVMDSLGLYGDVQGVVYITVLAVLVTAGALWLRWRKTTATAELAIASPEVMTTETELPPGESSNQE